MTKYKQLTLFVEGSHAKTSQQQAKAKALSMVTGLVFGGKCIDLSITYSQELQCWKMCQPCCGKIEACTLSCKTWHQSGMMQIGAPHLRKRVFIIAYPSGLSNRRQCDTRILHDQEWHTKNNQKVIRSDRHTSIGAIHQDNDTRAEIANISEHSNSKHIKEQSTDTISMESQQLSQRRCSKDDGIQQRDYQNYWQKFPTQSPLCHRNDGLSNRLARLRALGNAIVPQCSEYIGKKIFESNLLDYKY